MLYQIYGLVINNTEQKWEIRTNVQLTIPALQKRRCGPIH